MVKKLYVGNLSFGADEASLRSHFGGDGRQVSTVKIMVDRETGRSRGFAFVEMATPEDAQKAIQALNNVEFMGRPLAINEAREPGPRPEGGGPRPPRGPRPGGPGGAPGGYGGGQGGGFDRGPRPPREPRGFGGGGGGMPSDPGFGAPEQGGGKSRDRKRDFKDKDRRKRDHDDDWN